MIVAVETVAAELGRPRRPGLPAPARARGDGRPAPPSSACAPGAWSPACSRPSTPPGAGTPACTPSGSASTGPLATNPFADLADAGVALALGSDAPVTPLDPWGGVHAAVDHRTPGSGLRPFDAFDAATHGGWYAARAEHPVGPLAVGAPAHLALWATDQTLSAVLAERARPACRRLLVDGTPIGDIAHDHLAGESTAGALP